MTSMVPLALRVRLWLEVSADMAASSSMVVGETMEKAPVARAAAISAAPTRIVFSASGSTIAASSTLLPRFRPFWCVAPITTLLMLPDAAATPIKTTVVIRRYRIIFGLISGPARGSVRCAFPFSALAIRPS